MVGIRSKGPSPLRLISKREIKFGEPAKKVFGLRLEKTRACGAMYSSVVGEMRGYDARMDSEKGE